MLGWLLPIPRMECRLEGTKAVGDWYIVFWQDIIQQVQLLSSQPDIMSGQCDATNRPDNPYLDSDDLQNV